jgi:hypothetical protein
MEVAYSNYFVQSFWPPINSLLRHQLALIHRPQVSMTLRGGRRVVLACCMPSSCSKSNAAARMCLIHPLPTSRLFAQCDRLIVIDRYDFSNLVRFQVDAYLRRTPN